MLHISKQTIYDVILTMSRYGETYDGSTHSKLRKHKQKSTRDSVYQYLCHIFLLVSCQAVCKVILCCCSGRVVSVYSENLIELITIFSYFASGLSTGVCFLRLDGFELPEPLNKCTKTWM